MVYSAISHLYKLCDTGIRWTHLWSANFAFYKLYAPATEIQAQSKRKSRRCGGSSFGA